MRDFLAGDGSAWTADVRESTGPDYKGRFYLVVTDSEGVEAALVDVRWNNERTAKRTIDTMSETELRRRLRSALGRGQAVAGA
jgi:hypothetical protein